MIARLTLLCVLLLLAPAAVLAQASPYAGQETRAIKALSASEIEDLLAGRGMGLAKVAELNGFPGPMHVLEVADAIALTGDQRRSVEESMARMQKAAQGLGAELVDAERHLDMRFAHNHIDATILTVATRRIGELQASLRAVHLTAHLEMKALLTPEQIARYMAARGYGEPGKDHHSHRPKH